MIVKDRTGSGARAVDEEQPGNRIRAFNIKDRLVASGGTVMKDHLRGNAAKLIEREMLRDP